MSQPKHPAFPAFVEVVQEGKPPAFELRRPLDETAQLLGHGVQMLVVEGSTAHLDDREAGNCHLLFKTWRDAGYARLSLIELATSYFLTAHDPRGESALPATEVPFSQGLEPLPKVLQDFVDWTVNHAANMPPDLSRPARSRLPDPDGNFGSHSRRRYRPR